MRYVLAVLAVAVLATPAVAGQRCARQRDIVFITPDAQLDEAGYWMRRSGELQKRGRLSVEALGRITSISGASSEQLVRCLDALIDNEDGAAANRACRAPAKK